MQKSAITNKSEYKIIFSYDLREPLDEARRIENSVNAELAKFGFDEKISIRGKAPFTLKSQRELKKDEKEVIGKMILEDLNAKFQGWNFRIESFRRQSCSQSRKNGRSQSRK